MSRIVEPGRRGALAQVVLALVVAALIGSGCRVLPPAEFMRGAPLPVDDPTASRMLDDYLARTADRSVLRGSARVALSGPDFKLNRPQNVIVARPARLRLEVVGLFEQLAAVLVSDGATYGFYDGASGRMEAGAVEPGLLFERAQIDVGVAEAVGVLLAAPRPPSHAVRAAVWREDASRTGIGFALGAARRRRAECEGDAERGWRDAACFASPGDLAAGGDAFVFDERGRLVELRSFEAGGVLRYRATFEDFDALGEQAEKGPVEFPRAVTIDSPRSRSAARFTWKRVVLGGELAASLFRLPDRKGSQW